ncbi:MAG: YraN family protein [Anaerolineae bacterium]|nr:YraN family protein [Anaerolineae bacterium]
MSDARHKLGQQGENWVAAQMQRSGYVIRDRNWRHPESGELDIVAQHGGTIVFVEVRTRRGPLNDAVTHALESVNAAKQTRLARLAEAYLAEHDLDAAAWRIDVAAVGFDGHTFVMEVITDAVDW